MPSPAQLDELRHFHVFGDTLSPMTNDNDALNDLHALDLVDRTGPVVAFINRPPSHWRYTLNDAGRAAIITADGKLPPTSDRYWRMENWRLSRLERRAARLARRRAPTAGIEVREVAPSPVTDGRAGRG